MKTEFVLGKPTTAQADYLADAVGWAYRAGWKGSMREKARPRLARWVARPSRAAMRSKGLVEFTDETGRFCYLTMHGVAAGETAYKAKHGESAQARAELGMKKEQEAAQARQDRKDKIAHLFRGLYLHRESGFRKKGGKKYRSVAAHLESSSSIQMNEEDLLALGEGIEKLR